jgi:hypothetical protein
VTAVSVVEEVEYLHPTLEDGRLPVVMPMRLSWTVTDLFAVTATFYWAVGKQVEWVFDTSLLTGGLRYRTGDGDVVVEPDPDDNWSLLLNLSAPSGRASFRLPADFVADFVADVDDASMGVTPVFDWDSEVVRWTEVES